TIIHAPTIRERIASAFAFFAPKAAPMTAAAPPPPPPPPPPPGTTTFDFDGDTKADIGIWHSANTAFTVKNRSGSAPTNACASGAYSTCTIGSSAGIPAPGDFDGDGKTDVAVFAAGTWTIKKSQSGTTSTVSWGSSGDIPVTGDYDGDGKADVAIF